jgi:hypothetical protein
VIVVDLALAVICVMGECHPALVGEQTPRGVFALDHQATEVPGYGGDLLVFQEDRTQLWAIHRVYTAKASERRVERLLSGRAASRKGVTHGCVNVMPEVYARLVACCSHVPVMIR